MSDSDSRLDNDVRVYVYETAVATGKVPKAPEIAANLGRSIEEVEASIQRLGAARVWILAPGTANIWGANPFAAVPSNFRVQALERTYWAICIWDALGIPASLHANAEITTFCPDCGDQMTLRISDGHLSGDSGIVHFAVPALQWWQNITFT